jgi:hypothetical protein
MTLTWSWSDMVSGPGAHPPGLLVQLKVSLAAGTARAPGRAAGREETDH